MSFYRNLVEFSGMFPDIGIDAGSGKPLAKLGYGNGGSWLLFSLILSVAVAIAAVAVLAFMQIDMLLAAPGAFAGCFIFLLRIPQMELKRKAAALEAELPLMLRELGLLLDMKVPFQRALKISSQKEGELAYEMDFVAREAESGVSMQKALSKLASRIDSLAFKRAIAQLIFAYELGERGREISRIGDDVLLIQQHKVRDFASRSAIFGLLFLSTTAILPTFFLIYSFLSGAVFKAEISETAVTFALLVAFPALSLGIIAISKLSLPPSAFKNEENSTITIATIAMAIISAAAVLVLDKPIVYAVFPLQVCVLGALFYPEYKKDKIRGEVDKYLADAFFALANLPKSTRVEMIFSIIKDADYGELSKQAEISLRQVKANVKPESAIADFAKRSNSALAKRACGMLNHALNTNSFESLNAIAEDVLKFFELERERERTLAMQKYTILFGGFIIPVIIKVALSLLEKTSSLMENGANGGYLEVVIPAYLLMYSVLAGNYAADIEGRRTRAAFYFIIISCSSLAIFYFIKF